MLLYELLLCGGMLGSLLADRALMHTGDNNWRWMVGIPVIPAAVLAGDFCILLVLMHLLWLLLLHLSLTAASNAAAESAYIEYWPR